VTRPRRVLLVFVDGVGMAPPSASNPFARVPLAVLGPLLDPRAPLPRGGILVPTDATLGVEGLPQSATGQTAILTGRNAARAVGRHVNGFPGPSLVAILREATLYRPILAAGLRARFLNTFTEPHRSALMGFAPLAVPARVLGRSISATTHAALAAGLPLFGPEDLAAGRSLFHDFTNDLLAARGVEAPRRTPEEAGALLAAACRAYEFAFYEYFLTDVVGHAGDPGRAVEQVRRLDAFLASLVSHADDDTLLLVTSDHGNLEDLSSRSHTRNPVATLLFGPGADAAAAGIRSLVDIAPAVHGALGLPGVTRR
jgi:2,3-bisphosphoglycerate-independent phosphoglycerate mutase